MDAKPGENKRPVLFLLINGQKIRKSGKNSLQLYRKRYGPMPERYFSAGKKCATMRPEKSPGYAAEWGRGRQGQKGGFWYD
jgi:hypothetical protein